VREKVYKLLTFPPFGLGYMAGFVMRALRLFRAALVEGYARGKQL
jgi:hypothetical protein